MRPWIFGSHFVGGCTQDAPAGAPPAPLPACLPVVAVCGIHAHLLLVLAWLVSRFDICCR